MGLLPDIGPFGLLQGLPGRCINHHIMMVNKPDLFVRYIDGLFEYFILQGENRVNFYLDLDAHEALKAAQSQADASFQKQEPIASPLRVVS